MNLHELACCGAKEINGLSNWSPGFFQDLVHRYHGQFPAAYIIFNGVEEGGYVRRFKAFVLEEGLGEVTQAPLAENPNTHRLLDLCVWTINRQALQAWHTRKEAERDKTQVVVNCGCGTCTVARMAQMNVGRAKAAAIPPTPGNYQVVSAVQGEPHRTPRPRIPF